MKRKSAIARILVWTVVSMVLLTVLVIGTGTFSLAKGLDFGIASGYNYSDADAYVPGNMTAKASNIHELDIHWVAGSVEFSVYDGDEIRIHESAPRDLAENEQLHTRIKGDRLTVEYCASKVGNSLFNRIPEKALVVQVPSDIQLTLLSFENVSSNMRLDGGGLSVDKLAVENVSGSVTISAVNASKLELETVSGSVDCNGVYEKIDAEGVSGSQTYRLATLPTKMEVDSVSGSITIFTPADQGFTAKVDSVSGSLHSDLGDQTGKRSVQHADGAADLRFDTVSGSVSIRHDDTLKPTAPAKPTTAPAATPSPAPDDSMPSGGRSF